MEPAAGIVSIEHIQRIGIENPEKLGHLCDNASDP